uniref:Uncharacterized protein n=1 Tax=Corethron hystrix TaxID=216773 RepID=A0A7S1B6P9_9STRA
MKVLALLSALGPAAMAFSPAAAVPRFGLRAASSTARNMITITDGVEFDTIAREWRCKWSPDDEKASLASAQKALDEVVADIKVGFARPPTAI